MWHTFAMKASNLHHNIILKSQVSKLESFRSRGCSVYEALLEGQQLGEIKY